MGLRVRRSEVVGLLAMGQDLAFGQPEGSWLRSVVLADELALRSGWAEPERDAVWWVTALRSVGATASAFETAALLGDDIEGRAALLRVDGADPRAVLRFLLDRRGPSASTLGRASWTVNLLTAGRAAWRNRVRTELEVTEALADRLGMGVLVRSSLQGADERWNGKGLPDGRRGTQIAGPMRLAQLAADLELLDRERGTEVALAVVAERAGRTYDPALADLVAQEGSAALKELELIDPWDAAMERRPSDDHQLGAHEVVPALEVVADFVDLKSTYTAGHSRRVAALCRPVASDPTSALDAEAAGLLHDLGQVALPNPLLDKTSPLTRAERDQVHRHARTSEAMVRRVPGLAALAATVGGHHERLDGSGYHRRAKGDPGPSAAALAAAECYAGMTEDRAHRVALHPNAAADELRAQAEAGRLSRPAVEGILAAAGHRARQPRPDPPAGLTAREIEVLDRLVRGEPAQELGQNLGLSTKTVQRHVQSLFAKIGCSTRGAAALFAAEHGLARHGAPE